ncbi:MAG: OmpA family protein [Candidatus Kapaibacteriales bacterium]
MRNLIKAIVWILTISLSFALSQQKVRLPKSINSSSSNLLPVISPDGDELYFDRKWHPSNFGSLSDADDIWVAKKLDSINWKVYNDSISLNTDSKDSVGFVDISCLNLKESNALFYLFPSGTKALVYGNYGKNNEPTFAITKKINMKWTKPEPIRIKNFYNLSKSFSGTISADGRILLLSLKCDDSGGDLDIYVSFWNDTTGEYSEPKNIGTKINSDGIDFVSYLAYDNRTMYFASARRKGKNNLDLFLTRRLDESWLDWSEPIALDSIINSKWDENSISLTITGDSAYFVSGDDSTGMSGIYFAELPTEYRPLPYLVLRGSIFDESSTNSKPIEQPVWFRISDFDRDYVFYDTVYNGKYRIVIPYNTQYNIIVGSKGYTERSFSASSYNFEKTKVMQYDISLRPKKERKSILAIVYFETDIDTLDSKAKEIIDDLKEVFSESYFSKIEIVGHTDEIGSDEYNIQLSLRRARSVAQYLTQKFGINPLLIKTIGKGKTEPVSIEYDKNRRAVIYLVEND